MEEKFCTGCGQALPVSAGFCSACGRRQAPRSAPVDRTRPDLWPAEHTTAAPAAAPSAPDAQTRPIIDRAGERPRPPQPSTPVKRSRLISVIVAVALIMIAFAIAFAAVSRFAGDPLEPVAYFPEDTPLVVVMDFLQLRETDRVERFIDAVTRAGEDADTRRVDYGRFDDWRRLNVSVEEDLLPWIGRSGALGLVPGGSADALIGDRGYSAVLVIQSRDRAAAEAFVERAVGDLAAVTGQPISRFSTSGGEASGWMYAPDSTAASQVWAVTAEAVIIGPSPEAVEAALSTKAAGGSLVADTAFIRAHRALPSKRDVLVFVSGGLVRDHVEHEFGYLGTWSYGADSLWYWTAIDALAPTDGFGLSASLVDAGMVIDAVEVRSGRASSPSARASAVRPADVLPSRTIMFQAWHTDAGSLASLGDELARRDRASFQQVTEDLSREFGSDVFDTFLPFVSGSSFIAAVDNRPSPRHEDPVGFVLWVAVEDSQPLRGAVDDFTEYLRSWHGLEVTRRGAFTVAEDRFGADLGYTLEAERFVFAVPVEVAEHMFDPRGPTLADSPLYRRLEAGLGGRSVDVFLDVGLMLEAAEAESPQRRAWRLVPGLAASVHTGGGLSVRVFVAVEY